MMIFYKIVSKVRYLINKKYNKKYEESLRKRLKNDNFSIICSNCVGGVIYNRLGRKFLSPTINLWMHQQDFLKFVEKLRDYTALDLEFVDSEYDYPVALLGDIKIHFNHYKTEREAEECWNRRKSRINYDNLFIIMYERDNITVDDFRILENIECKNKIVFSDKRHPDIDYIVTMETSNRQNGQQCLDRDWLGRRTFEKQVDYVKWLNCE